MVGMSLLLEEVSLQGTEYQNSIELFQVELRLLPVLVFLDYRTIEIYFLPTFSEV